MFNRSFKDIHASCGPDKPKTPSLSRAERLAKVAPPIVAELLERRQMLSVTAAINSGVLVATSNNAADTIEVWVEWGEAPDPDTIFVGDGNGIVDDFDLADVTANRADVYGNDGNDTIKVWSGGTIGLPFGARIYGGSGHDVVELATDHGDTIYGGTGDDSVNTAEGGNDLIFGEDGDDDLFGSGDADIIYGGAGYDFISGGFGTDLVYGDDGNDTLEGNVDADTIYGGVGYDNVDGGTHNDVIYGGTGSGDNSDSVTGYDSLVGDDGNDTIRGEGGGDTLLGGDENDVLLGGDGNDSLRGDAGTDAIDGAAGDDTLDARDEGETDTLWGGSGNDCGYWIENEDVDNDMEGNFL